MSTKIENDKKVIPFPSKQVLVNYALEDPNDWVFLKMLNTGYFSDKKVNTNNGKVKVKTKKKRK